MGDLTTEPDRRLIPRDYAGKGFRTTASAQESFVAPDVS